MKTFPMFLQLAGREVLIVGGGEQAAQKTRLMLKTEARITLLAPVLDDELSALRDAGRIAQEAGPVTAERFRDAALVFIATGCPGWDAAVQPLARAAGALVNVVDNPALCDAFTPSIVDRDPLVVAIGTEGAAPVLARQIRAQVETMLEPRLGDLVATAGRLRGAVAGRIPKAGRRAFWRWAFSGTPRRLHGAGAERDALRALKSAIAEGAVPEETEAAGIISLVGAGPGARDLLTLRAVQRLQEADVIFYDRLVDPDVLEMARRDAERVCVGKTVGAHEWPQEKIDALIVATARQGKRVVRLKSGDPGIFGRATEELSAARAAGITVEIVPGVSAALAAGAALGRSLTERGETDRLVMATGMCREGDAAPDWAAMVQPGTVLALYMAVRQAGALRARLLGAGLPEGLEVEVVSAISTRNEKQLRTTLAELPEALAGAGIDSPAILLLRYPKRAAQQVRRAG